MAIGERWALWCGDVRIEFDPLPIGVAYHQSFGCRQSLWPRYFVNPAFQIMCQGAFVNPYNIDMVFFCCRRWFRRLRFTGSTHFIRSHQSASNQIPQGSTLLVSYPNRRTYGCAHFAAIFWPYGRLLYKPVGVSIKAVVSRPRCHVSLQVDLNTR